MKCANLGHIIGRICTGLFPALVFANGLALTAGAEVRTWRSADGQYTVQAELLRETSVGVALRKTDGDLVNVPLSSLSAGDRRFIERHRIVDSTPVLAPNEYGPPIDLIDHVDVDKAIKGTWQRDEDGLVTGKEFQTHVKVGYSMPEEYELRMNVQMIEGSDTLAVALPIANRVALILIDSFGGQWTGINKVSGFPIRNNVTTYRRRAIDDHDPHELVFTVLKNHVSMTLDGENVFRWSGDPKRLWWHDAYWNDEDFPPRTLVLGSFKTSWKIHEMSFRPVYASRINEIPFSSDSNDIRRSLALIETASGSGSGFVAGHGLVVTNHHVVADATVDEMRVYFGDENDFHDVKRVLASSEKDDLAVLEVDTDCNPLPIAWDGVIPKGETVRVHGNPAIEGGVLLRGAVVEGQLQSRLRMEGQDYLQIAANVNPGSSGGPVLNRYGQVIGVIVMKATGEGESFLRDAAKRFDSGGESSDLRRGVALAVPGSTLCEMLESVSSVTVDQADRVTYQHDSSAVVNRGFRLAGYEYLRLLGNASRGVLMQAQRAGAGGEDSAVPPVELWAKLQMITKSAPFQKQISNMRSHLDEQLGLLMQPGQATNPRLTALRELNTQLKRLKRAADAPPTSFTKYQRLAEEFGERLDKLSTVLLADSAERGPG